jgi:hypothetical protein
VEKLKLDLENIQVESLPTLSEAEGVRTVNAYEDLSESDVGGCFSSRGTCGPSYCILCTPPTTD